MGLRVASKDKDATAILCAFTFLLFLLFSFAPIESQRMYPSVLLLVIRLAWWFGRL